MAATWCATTPSSVPEGQKAWAFVALASGQWFLQGVVCMITPPYAELHCLSAFSFQRGPRPPDGCSSVRPHSVYSAFWPSPTNARWLASCGRPAARRMACPLIVGAEFRVHGGRSWSYSGAGPAALTSVVPADHGEAGAARRKARTALRVGFFRPAGRTSLSVDLATFPDDAEAPSWLQARFVDRLWLSVQRHREPGESERVASADPLAEQHDLRWLPRGVSHACVRATTAAGCLTAIRHHCTVADAGGACSQNGERHLRPLPTMEQLHPLWLANPRIARRCQFELDRTFVTPIRTGSFPGETPHQLAAHLTRGRCALAMAWASRPKARQQIEYELALIAELQYESHFPFRPSTTSSASRVAARSSARDEDQRQIPGLLCQGRNRSRSRRMNILFERFLSRLERNEPPDIDIDFEHQRRGSHPVRL